MSKTPQSDHKTPIPSPSSFQPNAPSQSSGETSFLNVPTGTASDMIMTALDAGEKIAGLPGRKSKVNHSTEMEVQARGKQRRVTMTNKKAEVTIEIPDLEKMAGSNKAAKKLFVFALIKANEQAIHDGTLTKDHVSFPLQELVDKGIYSLPRSARRGFAAGMEILTSLKVKGRIQQGKKKSSSIDALEVLFTGARIENGQCTIFLNDRINWGFIAQYFTIIPSYYFWLPNRASTLLYYIFFLARQHANDIEKKGYFTISFRAIWQRLNLPSEEGNKEPNKTIRQPIEDAIAQIETQHSNTYNNMEFRLLPVYNEASGIADFLDNGYLKVELLGSFSQHFVSISRRIAARTEAAQKRRDRIEEKAKAINLAKKMEEEEAQSQANEGAE